MKEISRPQNEIDDEFYADVKSVGEKYLCGSLGGKNWKEFLLETLDAANRYKLTLPFALILLIKQVLYLDGLGRMMGSSYALLANGKLFSEYYSILKN